VCADERLWLSKSWTTREPRPSENGDEYHFVDRATFESAIEAHQFLEWAEFHGHLYGTPQPAAPPGCDLLLEIEVQGQSRSAFSARRRGVLILPPSMERLEERLRARGTTRSTSPIAWPAHPGA